MTKEKLVSLTKYLGDLTNKLSSITPEKHKGHEQTYKNFLKNEIRIVEAQLESVRLEGLAKK